MRSLHFSPHRQQGATLVMGIITLVLITLLVLAAGRGIKQQNTMAGNTRERDVAFQAAEAALRDAESRMSVFHAAFAGTGLITTSTTADVTARATAEYWMRSTALGGYGWYTSTGAVDTAKSIATSTTVAGVDQQPRYVVERLPNGPSPGDCGTGTHFRYRVTAIGVGASSGAKKSADSRVILQSEYRVCG